jgi:hypothetical protein
LSIHLSDRVTSYINRHLMIIASLFLCFIAFASLPFMFATTLCSLIMHHVRHPLRRAMLPLPLHSSFVIPGYFDLAFSRSCRWPT